MKNKTKRIFHLWSEDRNTRRWHPLMCKYARTYWLVPKMYNRSEPVFGWSWSHEQSVTITLSLIPKRPDFEESKFLSVEKCVRLLSMQLIIGGMPSWLFWKHRFPQYNTSRLELKFSKLILICQTSWMTFQGIGSWKRTFSSFRNGFWVLRPGKINSILW